MSLPSFRSLFAIVFLATMGLARAGTEDAILAKARAYAGPEAALNAVTSVHFVGSLDTGDGSRVAIEIIFQKPSQQKVIATGPNLIEVTALDDYEGWMRTQDAKDPSRWNLVLLQGDQVRRLQANVVENLNFFRSSTFTGTITDGGIIELEGRKAHRVSFDHGHGIVFTRYFDEETGRMMRTETDQSSVIREEGEVLVNGIRFPKRILNTNPQADGTVRTVTIEIEKVSVNEVFAASLFAVPMFSSSL
jgi:outer membrane lipoprotein-sorting protein